MEYLGCRLLAYNTCLINILFRYSKIDGEQFLQCAKILPPNRYVKEPIMVLFMSSFGQRLLETSDSWMMDGTFNVESPFKQLYVIFTYHKSK